MHSVPIAFLLTVFSVAAGFCAHSPRCNAQPLGKTVFVAYGDDALQAALAAVHHLEAEATARRVPIISMHDARDRFSLRSRSPQTASASDLDALAKEAQQAIHHVAFGRTAAAQHSVQEIIALAERSLESLNRETATARQLLDACLALVRASAHDGKRDVAIEQAMRCRRLVPDLSPNESSHPANVIGVLAEADDQLRRMRVGKLSVRNRPERSCAVYLNGRHLGTTPFALDRASVGEYRVQVECDQNMPGRVHIVQLGDDPVELTVDTAFDAAIVTDPRLALRYASAAAARSELVEHAIQLGRDLRAEDVILVGATADKAELLRVQVGHQRLVAGFALPMRSSGVLDRQSLSQSLDALAQGRFVGVRPEDYQAATSAEARPASAMPPRVADYTVKTKPVDARLLLDGSVVTRAPGDLLQLRLGTHVLEVRGDGYRSAVRDLQVSDPGPKRIDIALEPLAQSAPRQAKALRKKWWFWTTLGVMVAGGVTAGLVVGLRDRDGGSQEPTIDVMGGDLSM
jgi:hypothetical protein